MARLKLFLDVFSKVTTGIALGAAIYCTIFFSGGMFSEYILWQLLLTAFLTSLGVLLYTDDIKKKSMKMVCVLHYLFNNVVVIGCGIWFEWIDAGNWMQIISMAVLVAVIFGTVSVILWKKSQKEAELMNERLVQYQANAKER